MDRKIFFLTFICFIVLLFQIIPANNVKPASAYPFYKRMVSFDKKSSFDTGFSSSTDERKHNIKLCSSKINNTVLECGEEFSFNKKVGKRTEKNGYKKAKIIVDGKFVDGVGGGVCQVSTTLYNAVILAGLTVNECHPHSLGVSYVSPSFDAMVSSSSDLRFTNTTNGPLLIKISTKEDVLRVEIYGEKDEYSYERLSEECEVIPEPEPEVIYDDNLFENEITYLSYGKTGLKSKGYILKYKNGKLIEKRLIRKDTYKPIKAVVTKGTKIVDVTESDFIAKK